ncbi:MAG: esterase [Betaproteobacteria bacterium]|nr:esterase [Betaproteobacteria bacterium]
MFQDGNVNQTAADLGLGPAPISHMLYLHGFRSSPQSAKARWIAAWLQQHRPDIVWCCPQLPASPRACACLLASLVKDWPRASMAVIGSSLGGFYATWAAATWGCAAVLLNPAVDPARDLKAHIGEHTVWQSPAEKVYFDPLYIDELKALYVGANLSARLLAVIASGDEVLDWHDMSTRYARAAQHIIPGSDHGLSDFAHHWPVVRQFLQI